MAVFLLSLVTRNTIAIGLLDLHGMPRVSIQRYPIHPNIPQSMAYEISKHRILQHWNDRKLTHTSDWDEIDLTSLKRAGETTTAHMEHLIKNA